MADNILPHVNADSYYKISLQGLEEIHFKVSQSHAVLTILSDWVTECSSCSLSLKQKGIVDFILFLLTELMKRVRELLPEL